ncbi:MAG: glycosyl transferase family 2 [Bacteroidota bacterium]
MGKTGIIIQARTGSKRLPNKMIIPFYKEKGVFELLLEKITNIHDPFEIILATTISEDDNVLEKIALKYGVKTFRGSVNNVLSRFLNISDENNYDNVIRICADNPFFLTNSISQLKNEIENNDNLDYVSFNIHGKPSILSHFGLWGEAVSVDALKKIAKLTDDSLYYEHVTNYIHSGNPKIFNIKLLETDNIFNELNDIRLTLDTSNDFKIQQKIYNDLYKNNQEIDFNDIVSYVNNHVDLKRLMKKEIAKNEK